MSAPPGSIDTCLRTRTQGRPVPAGSRTRNWATRIVRGQQRRYDYPRWEFANRSGDIIDLCCWTLDLAAVAALGAGIGLKE